MSDALLAGLVGPARLVTAGEPHGHVTLDEATVEAAVRGLTRFDIDFLTVHGDPHVVRAAKQGAAGTGTRASGP